MTLLIFDYSNLRRVLLEALVIICSGILLGLTFNYALVSAVFKGELTPPTAHDATQSLNQLPLPASLADVREATTDTVLVDARIEELYVAAHLPGALSLPLADIETRFNDFAANVPKDKKLIVYCNGYGCPDSFDLGVVLLQKGYQDVMVFEGGMPEWRDAGYKFKKGQP
jgi:rhodanese-related sulfurtransferase